MATTERAHHLRIVAAALTVVVVLLALPRAGAAAAAGGAEWPELEQLGLAAPSAEQRARAVIRYSTEGSVRSVGTVEEDGDETVIELASDILFDTDRAELPPAAPGAIAALLQPVPQGAALAVHGHTDATATDQHNLDLSIRRAEAVAAAIRAARPDLVLDVQGFGESRLKVEEGGDDIAEDRAANRRVELRYTG